MYQLKKCRKICFLGDNSTGKTSLIYTAYEGSLPKRCIPNVSDNILLEIKINDFLLNVQVWDTNCQCDNDKFRLFCYVLQTDIFILCFSIADRRSFERIKIQWLMEIKSFAKNSKILLIGTKSDLRKSMPPGQCISNEEALSLASEIHAFDYVECSSILNEGVKEAFTKIYTMLYSMETKSKKCNVS